MKRSNLTWHIQGNLSSEIHQIIAGSGAEFYKKMDPPDTDLFPGKKCIGRTYMDDQPSWDLVAQGAIGAEKWYNHWASFYESRSYVHAWEGPNEPPVAYLDQRLALNAFTMRFADIMHHIARPKRVVGLNTSRGCPDIPAILDLRGAIRACDYWGIHEYGAPTMDTEATWHCLRYRRFMEMLKLSTPPKIIIGECGIDDGAKHGWKTFAKTESEFMRQLAWYDGETLKDPYVKAICIFTAAPSGWDDFEVNATLSWMMAERIASAPVVEPPIVVTPMPPPITPQIVTAFSQRDPRWAKVPLGTGISTIGDVGCLLCAVASVLIDMGVDTDPLRLNKWLIENHGFGSGNLFLFGSVAPLGLRLVEFIECRTKAAPVVKLQKALVDGKSVIVEVDWQPGGTLDGHWVHATALGKRSGWIMDPWQEPGAELETLRKYLASGWNTARGIFAAAIYQKA